MTPYQMMEAIDDALEKVGALKVKYLRQSGWHYTCQTPGSYWMWMKELDGKHYLLGRDDADTFQRELDYREMNKPHDPVFDTDGACIVCGSSPDDWESPHRDRSSGDKSDE
jgi:hypothetical protein